MKICFIIPSMTGGGAERVTANLANRLDEMGHEVKIMMTASDNVDYTLNDSISVFQIGKRTHGSLSGRLQRITLLRNYFKQNSDIAYVSMETATNMFAVLAGLGLSVNLIISERSNPRQYEHQKLRNLTYSFAKKMVFQTEDAKNCYAKRLQKVGKIIGNPVTDEHAVVYQGTRNKRFVAVGRLETVKNYQALIRAFSKVVEIYPEYTLHFYGKGSLEQELKGIAQEVNISGKVHFEGFCQGVQEQIKDAMGYVLSSDYEGMSNSLLEAMSIGLPVISTDCPIGGSRMLIENMKNGLLVPVGDVNALAEAMKYMIDNPDRAIQMGKEAAKVNERYSIQKIADEWLQYMKE